jgi:hypothetical protein
MLIFTKDLLSVRHFGQFQEIDFVDYRARGNGSDFGSQTSRRRRKIRAALSIATWNIFSSVFPNVFFICDIHHRLAGLNLYNINGLNQSGYLLFIKI